MDTATDPDVAVTAPRLAERLGISLARAHRLLDRHGVAKGTGSGRVRPVPAHLADRLVKEIGAVPLRVDGFDRVELMVLAAVSRAGLGLESNRAVARRAGVSPTAAGRSLASLSELGLVYRQERRVVQGRPRTLRLWMADFTSAEWTEDLLAAVKEVELPEVDVASPPSDRVPQRFHHHFWNAEPGGLSVCRDRSFIASRLLAADDPDAWIWVSRTYDPDTLIHASKMRGVSGRRRALIKTLAAAGEGR